MDVVERYEYKFLVQEGLVPAIRRFATSTSRLDPYAGSGGAYTIRSLYFDTPSLDLYAANEREQGQRFKIRARMYPDTAPKSPVFLEVKRRCIDVIVKSRAAIPSEGWPHVIEADDRALQSLSHRHRAAAVAFASRVHTYHLEPVVLVEYEREAYVSEVDSYARVTIDRRICVQRATTLALEADPKRWRAVDHCVQTSSHRGLAVLELKFERRPPAWMHAMVRKLELVRHSFSKYCYGVRNELSSAGEKRTPLLSAGAFAAGGTA